MGAYNASKYAVVAISETLARECADTQVGVSVLCPGFVDTRIHESVRNAPRGANLSTPAPEMADMIATILAAGQAAPAIAARVVQAIEADEFYILTHPELMVPIKNRFDAILAAAPK
jgi:NAD(P)-dependent dehydrogenase (short-subunit alcohol dehydrogenase family)